MQVLTGWLPVWGLFAALMVGAHGVSWHGAILVALRLVAAAALLALVVQRLTARFPWPRRIRPAFVAVHIVLAVAYSISWLLLNSVVESVRVGAPAIVVGLGLAAYLSAGVWLYVMIAGITYAIRATERAAQAEASAARSQLTALRSQLHPHFLFNALHTVVQLIPIDPRRAAQAAELLAGLLRRTIEDDRDLVPLSEEWEFVGRYLELERIRFGDRLLVDGDIPAKAKGVLVPMFALQTLVENAVRHGAAPKVEPTEITIVATLNERTLTITVSDNGAGASEAALASSTGTALRRLRERLVVLYAGAARLDVVSKSTGGFNATLRLPAERSGE